MDYLLSVLTHLSARISPYFDKGYIGELESFIPSIKTH